MKKIYSLLHYTSKFSIHNAERLRDFSNKKIKTKIKNFFTCFHKCNELLVELKNEKGK